jgi:hypothetical protein
MDSKKRMTGFTVASCSTTASWELLQPTTSTFESLCSTTQLASCHATYITNDIFVPCVLLPLQTALMMTFV